MKSQTFLASAIYTGILTALLIAFGVGSASASTVTFDYTGQNFDTPNPNADPTDFGNHLTASITLNCSPCNGTYYLNDPAVTSFQVSAGPYTAPASAFASYLGSDFVTISGGAITVWYIYGLDYPSSYAPTPGVPWGNEVILTISNDSNFGHNVGDSYSTFLGAQSASNSVAGIWTQENVAATPLPAALPLFATGLGALGLLGWRRKKKAAAPAA